MSCGWGVQKRLTQCVDNNGESLDDSFCLEERIIQQRCHDHECPVWETGEWSRVKADICRCLLESN